MTKANRLPNFIIAGAAKSGTTSLWHYLKQHPQIFMSHIKEPMFFVYDYYKDLNPEDPRYTLLNSVLVRTFEDYRKLFKAVTIETTIGEATAPYLYHYQTAITAIKRYLGDVRIIILLRNPIDRAFSAYTYTLRDIDETLSFEQCLEAESERVRNHWSMAHCYKGAGLYYNALKAYQATFSQVAVFLFEDLKQDTPGLLKQICTFLDVDPAFPFDISVRHNISGIPKNRFVNRLINDSSLFVSVCKPVVKLFTSQMTRRKVIEGIRERNLEKPQMKPETRQQLRASFQEDILKVQDLIQRDLTSWLK